MDTDESPHLNKNVSDNLAFPIAIIFLLIGLSMLVIIVFYLVYWAPVISSSSCENNNDCLVGQVCQLNICNEIICDTSEDCNGNGICMNSYCYSYVCSSSNDCPTGMACVDGSCLKVGTPCKSNNDCFQLSCTNEVCVQCSNNSTCPAGQGCFNNICRYPYQGETAAQMITYISPAQTNGNITAPSGYLCSTNLCGTGAAPIICGTTGTCPATCPHCVNSLCRCTSGVVYEKCQNNDDCESGVCILTSQGKFCAPAGNECLFNYNGTGSEYTTINGICPINKPYCVNGICSQVSLGAICGSTGIPDDICYHPPGAPISFNGTTATDGMGFFCVDGICQQEPGTLNQQCVPGSCEFIEHEFLTCTEVTTPTITQMRCLP